MAQLLMRLNSKDEYIIMLLKNLYGYTKTSVLIRHLLTNAIEVESKKERLNLPLSQNDPSYLRAAISPSCLSSKPQLEPKPSFS